MSRDGVPTVGFPFAKSAPRERIRMLERIAPTIVVCLLAAGEIDALEHEQMDAGRVGIRPGDARC
jgi:hypothetical protein